MSSTRHKNMNPFVGIAVSIAVTYLLIVIVFRRFGTEVL